MLSSVFAKTTGKEKNETKRLQAYLELKMTVKTVNEVAFLSCTSLIVYIELHSSVFSLVWNFELLQKFGKFRSQNQ